MNVLQMHWWLTFTLVFAQLAAAYGTGMAPLPAGKRQTCPNEGQPVTTGFDAQIVDCFPCMCKNGYVECENTCPNIDECHFVVKEGGKGCCKICKGCTYKGKSYLSHTEWTDPTNPCKVLRCEAGVVTVTDLHCYTPCPNPLPPEPGKCCRTCPVCQVNGQVVVEDTDVITDDDPCVKCRCSQGRLTCSKKACPVLQCRMQAQYKPPGECCPRCSGFRVLLPLQNSCTIQQLFFREGQKYKLDKCTDCECNNSTFVCTRGTCPILDCAPDLQKTFPGQCCPICIKPQVEEMISQCQYAGNIIEEGKLWPLDACSSCACHDGKVSCARTRCNTTCTSGMKTIHVPGECCPKCIENDGTCMAFGDPHYKTFDGKIYTFKGTGKYQLIEDCHNHTFSIKVANYMAHKYMDSTITKRVAINFGDIRLNLQQRLRVKYNGHKISIPFKKEGQFMVKKERDTIKLTLQNNVVIVWNGRSFLEVTVPPTYKGKLCGLCGNFNGDVQDDLRTKAGKNVTDDDLMLFGTSWCVGKKTECTKPIKPRQKSRGDPSPCKNLDNQIFAACEPKLSNSKYSKACKIDMYNCVTGRCYCESLMAYARECERLGVKLSHWQKHSRCDSHSPQRLLVNHHRQKIRKHSSYQTSSSEEIFRYPPVNLSKLRQNTSAGARKPIPLH